jgi:hypothetical protein
MVCEDVRGTNSQRFIHNIILTPISPEKQAPNPKNLHHLHGMLTERN